MLDLSMHAALCEDIEPVFHGQTVFSDGFSYRI